MMNIRCNHSTDQIQNRNITKLTLVATVTDLEVIGQLRTSGIARIHCYADVAVPVELKLGSLEHKPIHVSLYSSDNAQNLSEEVRQTWNERQLCVLTHDNVTSRKQSDEAKYSSGTWRVQ